MERFSLGSLTDQRRAIPTETARGFGRTAILSHRFRIGKKRWWPQGRDRPHSSISGQKKRRWPEGRARPKPCVALPRRIKIPGEDSIFSSPWVGSIPARRDRNPYPSISRPGPALNRESSNTGRNTPGWHRGRRGYRNTGTETALILQEWLGRRESPGRPFSGRWTPSRRGDALNTPLPSRADRTWGRSRRTMKMAPGGSRQGP